MDLLKRIGYLQTASMLLILIYYIPLILNVQYPTWVTVLFGGLLFFVLMLRSYYIYKVKGSYDLLLFVSLLGIGFLGFMSYAYFFT